jgi:hypothetical protein
MTIGGSTGLGSDLARVQQESFNSLVNLDCKRISNAITSGIIKKCVKKFFNTDDLQIRFEFVESDDTSPDEYLALAERCKNLGLTIDVAELKKLTKLSFISDEIKDVWQPEEIKEESEKD